MKVTDWMARLRRQPARRRALLALEELEPRVTPSIYYVSPSGNDNNTGTSQSAPWRNIDRVNRHAANIGFHAGEQILFQGGGQSFIGNLVLSSKSGGAPDNPVTIGSYSGRATINANNSGNGLLIDGASQIFISHLAFVDGGVGTSPLADTGIFVTGSGSNISIDDVEVSGFGGLGISINTDTSNVKTLSSNPFFPHAIYDFSRTGTYRDVSITNSSLHDNAVGGLDAHNTTNLYVGHVHAYHNAGLPAFWESGFGILAYSDDHSYNHAVVEYCVVHDNGYNPQSGGVADGIDLAGGTHNLVQFNESYNNRNRYDGSGVALVMTADSIMQFNYTHDNDGWGLYLGMEPFPLPSGYMSNNVIRYNISENDGSATNDHGDGMCIWLDVHDSDIYNNTIFTSTGISSRWKTAVQVINFKGDAVSVRNNLFVTSGSDTPNVNQFIHNDGLGSGTNLLFQGNDYWSSGGPFTITWAGSTYSSVEAFYQGAQQESLNGRNVGLQVNPLLTNPGGGGTIGNADQLNTLSVYKLADSSPVARAGLTLSQFGTTWDPFGFASDPFLKKYFDPIPRDFYGNVLPATNPSVGAYQVPPTPVIAVAAGPGGGPEVKVFNAETQTVMFDFFAYDANFTGGVRVATGDVNGDFVPDIVTAPGPGGGPDIHVYDGTTGQLIGQFFAFDPNFTGGSFVAVGDVDGDGRGDIIVGADAGGGPNVAVFSGKDLSRLLSFFPYDPGFTGGVRVAAGDVNGDGVADIVTGAGAGGGPNVTVYRFAKGQAHMLQSYFAYDSRFTAGVYVATGDVNGDGRADVVVGAGAGGGPNVAVFNGADGALLASFFAFDPAFTGGVRVAAVDRTGAGRASVIAVPGPGGGPQVRALDGLSGALLDSFFAYATAFTGGVFVAARG